MLLTLLVASTTLYKIWHTDRSKGLAVLRSLFQHLEYIKNTARAQERQMKKLGRPPSWTLITFDLNFYLPRIDYKIRVERGLKKIYTRELKTLLIKVSDNVNKINNLINLIYHAEVTENSKKKKAYMAELLSRAPYYPELYTFVKKSHLELNKVLKPIKRKI